MASAKCKFKASVNEYTVWRTEGSGEWTGPAGREVVGRLVLTPFEVKAIVDEYLNAQLSTPIQSEIVCGELAVRVDPHVDIINRLVGVIENLTDTSNIQKFEVEYK